jgi:hypothetical protein
MTSCIRQCISLHTSSVVNIHLSHSALSHSFHVSTYTPHSDFNSCTRFQSLHNPSHVSHSVTPYIHLCASLSHSIHPPMRLTQQLHTSIHASHSVTPCIHPWVSLSHSIHPLMRLTVTSCIHPWVSLSHSIHPPMSLTQPLYTSALVLHYSLPPFIADDLEMLQGLVKMWTCPLKAEEPFKCWTEHVSRLLIGLACSNVSSHATYTCLCEGTSMCLDHVSSLLAYSHCHTLVTEAVGKLLWNCYLCTDMFWKETEWSGQ